MTKPLTVSVPQADMLTELRENFFSVTVIMWDYHNQIQIICHPRQGHGEGKPDLEGKGDTLAKAIRNTWNKWMGVL